MRILLASPQPFYRERGTPLAVRMLVEQLCALGHTVDLLVYHARSYRDVKPDPLRDPNRHTRVKAIVWRGDGTPEFGVPPAEGLVRE